MLKKRLSMGDLILVKETYFSQKEWRPVVTSPISRMLTKQMNEVSGAHDDPGSNAGIKKRTTDKANVMNLQANGTPQTLGSFNIMAPLPAENPSLKIYSTMSC